MRHSLVGLLLALFLVHSASAVRCYQCRTSSNPNCAKRVSVYSGIRKVNCDHVKWPPTERKPLVPIVWCELTIGHKSGVWTVLSRDCHYEMETDPDCELADSKEQRTYAEGYGVVQKKNKTTTTTTTTAAPGPAPAPEQIAENKNPVSSSCHVCKKDYCNASEVGRLANMGMVTLLASIAAARIVL